MLKRCCRTLVVLSALTGAWRDCQGQGYSFTKVMEFPAPTPAGAFFDGPPAISHGKVAFGARFSFQEGGVYLGDGGPLTTLFSGAISTAPSMSAGAVAFQSFAPFALYKWSADDGLQALAQAGDPAPVGTFFSFENPYLRDGRIVFMGLYDGFSRRGLFLHDGEALTPLAAEGVPESVSWVHSRPSTAGTATAFVGGYGANPVEWILKLDGGTVSPIASVNDASPTGTFHELRDPIIEDDAIAFRGVYHGGARDGMFLHRNGTTETVSKWGDPAPSGFGLTSFEALAMRGEAIAFQAGYPGDSNGVFLKIGGGSPFPVIKTGDPLFGSTVRSILFGNSGLDDDGSLRIAFQYRLTSGVQGIAYGLYVPGDFDEDGDVDGNDLTAWKTNAPMAGATHAHGDADRDRDVDGNDFILWQRGLGFQRPAPQAIAVPEPGALQFAALACVLLAGIHRRICGRL